MSGIILLNFKENKMISLYDKRLLMKKHKTSSKRLSLIIIFFWFQRRHSDVDRSLHIFEKKRRLASSLP
jgi:hypothetical protein